MDVFLMEVRWEQSEDGLPNKYTSELVYKLTGGGANTSVVSQGFRPSGEPQLHGINQSQTMVT